MEQLDMFTIDMDSTQQLFRKFDIDLEYGQRYLVISKSGRIGSDLLQDNIRVVGKLIYYNNKEVAFGDTWVEDSKLEIGTEQPGSYADIIFLEHKAIQKIEFPLTFDFKIGLAYRAEIYRKNPINGRPTSWISCYYRGITHSSKIMLVTLGNNSEIIILNRHDIKGFFQLSLDEIKSLSEQEVVDLDIDEI